MQDEKPVKKSTSCKRAEAHVLQERNNTNLIDEQDENIQKENWIRDLTDELDKVSQDQEEKENLQKIQNPVRKKVVLGVEKRQESPIFFTQSSHTQGVSFSKVHGNDDTQPSNEFRWITGERPTFDCLKDQGEA